MNAAPDALGMLLPMVEAAEMKEWARMAAGLVFAGVLVWLSVVDLRIRRLPDRIVLPMLWAGLTLNAACSLLTTPAEAVLGAVAGYGSLWLLGAAWSLRRPGVAFGGGDLKTAAMIGAWLGVSALPAVLCVAFAVGSLAVLPALLLRRCKMSHEVPFGPALAVGGVAAMMAGEDLARLLFGYV